MCSSTSNSKPWSWSCSTFHTSLMWHKLPQHTYSIWLITGICDVIRRWLSLPVENNFPFYVPLLLNLRFLCYFLFRKLLRKTEAKWQRRSENKNLCFPFPEKKVSNDFYSIVNNFLFLRFPAARVIASRDLRRCNLWSFSVNSLRNKQRRRTSTGGPMWKCEKISIYSNQ